MSAELSLSILNPTIALAFSVLVAVLYRRWPAQVHLVPLGIAFFYLGLAFITQEWPPFAVPGGINFAGNAFFYGAVLLACVSALVRVKARVPVVAFAAITLVTVAGFLFLALVQPSTLNRVLLLNGSFAVLTGLTIHRLVAAGIRSLADRLFIAGVALGTVIAVARPMLILQQGFDIGPDDPIGQSTYWGSVAGLTPILSILIVAVFVFALVLEIMSKLQRAADEDHLTGLLNRRGFELAAGKALAEGAGGPAVLIADIDDFKQVNDRFGHAAGDRVITAVGTLLARHGRGDVTARIGGEEFALFYHDASIERLRGIADDISAALSRQQVPDMPEDYRATISMGLYRRAAEEPLDDMLNLADRALYKAKAAGKNRAATSPAFLKSA